MSTLNLDFSPDRADRQPEAPPGAGSVSGAPKLLLRLEGMIMLAAAAGAYGHLGLGWGLFGALFLVPDLSMIGYLAGQKIGSWTYNLGHTYSLPAMLAGTAVAVLQPVALALALIWLAHIGFDRSLGYGLKYGTGFAHTHLGMIGAAKGRK